MTKVGMLYICTGKYTVFWPEFYRTFNEKFLPNCEKEYFVFTDAPGLLSTRTPPASSHLSGTLPWPYSTLKRFSIFLTQETVLSKMDYLFFFNANLTCTQTITEEEISAPPRPGAKTCCWSSSRASGIKSRPFSATTATQKAQRTFRIIAENITFRAASTAARPRRFWRSAMSWSAAPRPTCNKMSSPFGMMKAS